MTKTSTNIFSPVTRPSEQAFRIARERYARIGVNVDQAIQRLKEIPISVHCWQGDDVGGFENQPEALSGGLAVTGSYPGKASSAVEIRSDLEKAFALIPCKQRLNLHAIYGESSVPVDRNQIGPEHFAAWIEWSKERNIGLDFNPSFFSHRLAKDGFTLAHSDRGIRNFWIEHGIACRRIGAAFGRELGSTCVTNFWIPDGFKDLPADRSGPRQRLAQSLDEIFSEQLDPNLNVDAVESKLFGIGSESYVVGSHEFYFGYALTRKKLLCLDTGHFHPTEMVSDKISSVLTYLPRILLHVSRGVRWDSDHVVTLSDELQAISSEIVRGGFLDRVHIGLDFFDASINRVAAWVIGARNMIKALLMALLEPADLWKNFELSGDYTSRLAYMEEQKTLPFGAVWDYYCMSSNVPVGTDWLQSVKNYETEVLALRSDVPHAGYFRSNANNK